MPKRTPSSEAFVDLVTLHLASVTWFWTDDKVHDTDYHLKVSDSMTKKLNSLLAKHDVTQDIRFCCQWEGLQVQGAERATVSLVANELASHLARFKGVKPLFA